MTEQQLVKQLTDRLDEQDVQIDGLLAILMLQQATIDILVKRVQKLEERNSGL